MFEDIAAVWMLTALFTWDELLSSPIPVLLPSLSLLFVPSRYFFNHLAMVIVLVPLLNTVSFFEVWIPLVNRIPNLSRLILGSMFSLIASAFVFLLVIVARRCLLSYARGTRTVALDDKRNQAVPEFSRVTKLQFAVFGGIASCWLMLVLMKVFEGFRPAWGAYVLAAAVVLSSVAAAWRILRHDRIGYPGTIAARYFVLGVLLFMPLQFLFLASTAIAVANAVEKVARDRPYCIQTTNGQGGYEAPASFFDLSALTMTSLGLGGHHAKLYVGAAVESDHLYWSYTRREFKGGYELTANWSQRKVVCPLAEHYVLSLPGAKLLQMAPSALWP